MKIIITRKNGTQVKLTVPAPTGRPEEIKTFWSKNRADVSILSYANMGWIFFKNGTCEPITYQKVG